MSNPLPLSLFALLRQELGQALQPLRCTKATLVHISHTLEDLVLSERLPALLFTGFQESSHWREETERYRALAEVAQQVCIFAGGSLPPESSARQLHVTLAGDDPLRQEWFLCILSERFAVLLCGQDRHVPVEEEAARQFDTLWSFSPAVVGQVLDRLEQVVGAYRPERLADLRAARLRFPPVPPDPDVITRFTAELIRYEEELQQRLAGTARQLDQQIRWREDLLATLVHDLRTPLQAVVLSLDVISARVGASSRPLADLIARSMAGVARIQSMVQLILDTNQLVAGELPLSPARLDLPTWAEDAVAACRSQAEHGQVALEVQASPAALWADPGLLGRALQNLVENAIKFTDPGGRVQVSVAPAPQPQMVAIRVRDTGRGIRPEALPTLFERYTQGSARDRRGYGLGLYFCRLVAEAHGGSIRAASQLGVGTTFTLTLPVVPPGLKWAVE